MQKARIQLLFSRKIRGFQRISQCQSPEKGIEPIPYFKIAGLFAGPGFRISARNTHKIADFATFSSPLLGTNSLIL